MPWDWGFTSILYRTDKVTDAVDSWDALLDPQYKGHISMWDDGPGAVTVSVLHPRLGRDDDHCRPARRHQAGVDRPEAAQLRLLGGRAGRSCRGCRVRRVSGSPTPGRAPTRRCSQGVPVAYADPKEGRNSWVGVYGIRKDGPTTTSHYDFLDAEARRADRREPGEQLLLRHRQPGRHGGITDPRR